MAHSDDPRDSEIEVRHLYRIARIPFHLTGRRAAIVLAALILIDILFAAAYLFSTLADVRALTVGQRLASLDLDLVANLPWGYSILKLYAASGIAALVVLGAERGQRAPPFWYVATATMAVMAVLGTTRLDEMWAAGLAVALFGDETPTDTYRLLLEGSLLGVLYIAALVHLPARSRLALTLIALSLAAFLLARAPAEWGLGPSGLFRPTVSGLIEKFGAAATGVAWHQGFRMLGVSFVFGALAFAIRDLQRDAVRYIYHGND